MMIKDIFGLIVRTLGLFASVWGAYDIIFAIVESAGLTDTAHRPPEVHATFGFLWVILGAVIMRNAGKVVNFAYCEDAPKVH
jgi:hypothetical protein